MRSVNKVFIIGNVTRDPETKVMPNGQKVCTFSVATNRDWTTDKGEKKSLAEFHNVVVWAKLADLVESHVRKGKYVYLEGYLKTRSWDTPEGVKVFKTEIVALDVVFLDKKEGLPEIHDDLESI